MTDEEKKAIERLDCFEPDDLVECAMYRDCVETIMELEQSELDVLIKFAKANNKNSKYGCQPSIEIYTEFELIKDDENDYGYYRINYESNLIKE